MKGSLAISLLGPVLRVKSMVQDPVPDWSRADDSVTCVWGQPRATSHRLAALLLVSPLLLDEIEQEHKTLGLHRGWGVGT
jgi:hypothetical protein